MVGVEWDSMLEMLWRERRRMVHFEDMVSHLGIERKDSNPRTYSHLISLSVSSLLKDKVPLKAGG